MIIKQLPPNSVVYDKDGNTWVPVIGNRDIPESAILYVISEDDGQAAGQLMVEPACTAMQECSVTMLDMICVDWSKNTAAKVLTAFEEHVSARYEAAYVELSALYEKAVEFWQHHGYQQIADLIHEDDDVLITLGKLLKS